jgi:hypothetical protein
MTLKRSMIAISAFAFLMSGAATLNAQTPPDQTPPPAVARDVADRDDDFDCRPPRAFGAWRPSGKTGPCSRHATQNVTVSRLWAIQGRLLLGDRPLFSPAVYQLRPGQGGSHDKQRIMLAYKASGAPTTHS